MNILKTMKLVPVMIGVLVLVGCIGKGELETSNWITYYDEDYNITLQYPPDWHHQEGGLKGFKTQGEEFQSQDNSASLVISRPNSAFASFKNAVEAYPYFSVALSEVTPVSIGNKTVASGKALTSDNIDTIQYGERVEDIDSDEFITSCKNHLLLQQTGNPYHNTENWTTYRNTDHYFQFKYPSEWGKIKLQEYSGEQDGFSGTLLGGLFDNTHYEDAIVKNTISFGIWSEDFATLYDSRNEYFDFSLVDLDLSEAELSDAIKLYYTKVMIVEKTTIDNKPALKLHEYGSYLGKCFERYHYLVPNINENHDNFSVTSGLQDIQELDQIVETLSFSVTL